MTSDVASAKRALRARMAARRAAHRGRVASLRNFSIARRVLRHPMFESARVVFAYAAAGGEADPALLVRAALTAGKLVAFPRIVRGRLAFHRVRDEGDLAPGRFGIPAPRARAGSLLAPDAAQLILVPGLAFTAAGDRLGRGGGHYDRVLARRRGLAVGLAFEFQVLRRLPAGPGDRPVDAVATERRLLLRPR